MRPKILFFSEAVTAAHLIRPYLLAKDLSEQGYEVHLATTQSHEILNRIPNVKIHELKGSVTSEVFLASLKKGILPFTEKILLNNYSEDQRILSEVQPDVVVDDFRLSLSFSTESSSLIHCTLTNITWSPYFKFNYKILPEIPIVKALGPVLSGYLFDTVKPIFEKKILKPFNKIRKNRGLSQISQLTELYTKGTHVAYVDPLEFAANLDLPENHRNIGSLLYSNKIPLPLWWEKLDRNKPWVYLSLGSSGRSDLIPLIMDTLKNLSCELIVSTSGKKLNYVDRPGVHIAPFLPDDKLLPLCQLYIGNGGSMGTQMALISKTKVLAIPENYDQWAYSLMLYHKGLIDVYRASRFNKKTFLDAVEALFFNQKPEAKSYEFKEADVIKNFKELIEI
jgi:UDP:flavonoid glycosyltransferase YjiC (YdhE family)